MFDKLDGSNIRAEWTKKKGFWKFGRRNGLLDDTNPILHRAPPLIMERYSEGLSKIFTDKRWQKAVCFFEFYGPTSFAGYHNETEEQTVTLIDVAADRKGFLEPKDFVRTFEDIHHAALLYTGRVGPDIVQQVKEGTLAGMTFEGVVCKGKYISPGLPRMFKIKNIAWVLKLKEKCGEDEALFRALV